MKRIRYLFCALVAAVSTTTVAQTPRQLIDEDPARSGGIYYAYHYTPTAIPAPPQGYEATFLSHYGRHGSRWLIKGWEYDKAIATLDSAKQQGGLTPFGNDVLGRLNIIAKQAKGRLGALSPKGENQHRDIAARMVARYNRLQHDSATIMCYSSTEPRCIMSMAAACESLVKSNPAITTLRHANPGDMDFISYSLPQAKAISSSSAAWWDEWDARRDTLLHPERLDSLLFIQPIDAAAARRLMWILHDIAVDTQDVDPGVELLDIFTPGELYSLWLVLNHKMYYQHGANPRTKASGPASASSLRMHIVADIDSAIAMPRHAATLRFGHDSALLRLLASMKIAGAADAVDDASTYQDYWRDYELSPMAANLQIYLYTSESRDDDPLVLILLNEKPAALPLTPVNDVYYRWHDVRNLWSVWY